MSILQSVLNAVGTVGDILDTPAAMLRSGLMGENPLVAALDTSKRHDMRDVLESYGVLGPNQDGLDAGDVVAGALGLVLDPMNLIPGLGVAKNLSKARALRGLADLGSQPGFPSSAIKALSGRTPEAVGPDDFATWTKSLTEPEIQALEHWSSSDGYAKINHLLRGETKSASGAAVDPFAGVSNWGLTRDEARDTANVLKTALSRSTVPHDAMVYRRMGHERYANGDLIDDPGFFATSTVKDSDGSFYGRATRPDSAIADVLVPKGHRAGLISDASRYGDLENEMLLPPGGSYRVLAQRDIPLVSFHGEKSQPLTWVRGTSPQDVIDHVRGMGRTPDPWLLKMAAGEEAPGYTLSRASQPNYLLEAMNGPPSLRRFIHHNLPDNRTLLSALAGYQMARAGSEMNEFTAGSGY